MEALGGYLRHAREPVLGRLAGELVRLVPDLPDRVGDLAPALRSDPETERYRLFDAVAAWLADVSAATPVVLVIDDLHWATRPTLLLLGHLVRSAEPLRILVVATYRDTELDLTAELADTVAELLRQPGVERCALAGLDHAGVSAFLEAQARHELDDAGQALAAALHAETGGNPFFVSQVLRHLGETGAVFRRGGHWTSDAPVEAAGIPPNVRDVIHRRMARLPDETRDLLALAAVLGDHFELAVLVAAARGGGDRRPAGTGPGHRRSPHHRVRHRRRPPLRPRPRAGHAVRVTAPLPGGRSSHPGGRRLRSGVAAAPATPR